MKNRIFIILIFFLSISCCPAEHIAPKSVVHKKTIWEFLYDLIPSVFKKHPAASVESPPPQTQPKIVNNLGVMLIDMQEKYVKKLAPEDYKRIVENQIKILEMCAKYDIPVFCIEFRGYGATIPELQTALKKVPRVSRINKKDEDALREEDDEGSKSFLQILLEAMGVKHLVLMGINADFCVKETAAHALKIGYKIMTSLEVISGDQNNHSDDFNVGWYKQHGTYFDSINALLCEMAA